MRCSVAHELPMVQPVGTRWPVNAHAVRIPPSAEAGCHGPGVQRAQQLAQACAVNVRKGKLKGTTSYRFAVVRICAC